MTLDPEASLIRAAQAGERFALERLWARHRPWLAALVLAHSPSREEVEDLLQEIALRVVREIGKLREPSALRAWLRKIALHTSASAGRKGTRRDRLLKPWGHELQEIEDPFEDDARERSRVEDEVERVFAMARRLPESLREPLFLKAVRGMTQKEIALALEITEAAVETRLSRARAWLRMRLSDAGVSEECTARRDRRGLSRRPSSGPSWTEEGKGS